jgi:hypothetical protein
MVQQSCAADTIERWPEVWCGAEILCRWATTAANDQPTHHGPVHPSALLPNAAGQEGGYATR